MPNKINERIKMYRKKFNCSKKEMAHLLGLKYTTYCRMEEMGNISGEWLLKIAEVFSIDVRELLYDKIPENKNWVPLPPRSEPPKNEPVVTIGYKYINDTITVMENLILKQLKRLSLSEQWEIFDITCKKVTKK